MDYYAEIRAFYDWNTFNSVPADAQALWHALMHLNNKCAIKVNGQWMWRVEFTVANGTLESMLRFSRTQLDRMRNILIQSGRIGYRKGRGNQSGTYRLILFDTQYVTQTVTQFDTQTDTQSATQTDTQVWHKPIPLNNTTSNYNNNSSSACARTREGELPKKPYGEFQNVMLDDGDLSGLYTREWDKPTVEAAIEWLSQYKRDNREKSVTVKDDYAYIKRIAIPAVLEQQARLKAKSNIGAPAALATPSSQPKKQGIKLAQSAPGERERQAVKEMHDFLQDQHAGGNT